MLIALTRRAMPPSDGDLLVPSLEVSYRNDMWRALPKNTSSDLYALFRQGYEGGSYVWDWKDSRTGTWTQNVNTTSISRYLIDFRSMEQRNIDNDRRRSVRFVFVRPQDAHAAWSGEIPEDGKSMPC